MLRFSATQKPQLPLSKINTDWVPRLRNRGQQGHSLYRPQLSRYSYRTLK